MQRHHSRATKNWVLSLNVVVLTRFSDYRMTAWFLNLDQKKNANGMVARWNCAASTVHNFTICIYYRSYDSLVYEITSFFAFSCRSEQYSGSAWLTKMKKNKDDALFQELKKTDGKIKLVNERFPWLRGETTGLPISSLPETGSSAFNPAPSSIFKLPLHWNKSFFSAYADLNIPFSLRS